MSREAIILAGGLGTRLRDTVPDLPKCMAPVAGRPFLFHVINYLRSQDVNRFVFSLGYKYEVIEKYLSEQFATLEYETVIEDEPLGTGGAIHLACSKTYSDNVLIANGDTLFRVQINELDQLHKKSKADCTLALKPMKDFDRYGVVELDEQNHIIQFNEKKHYDSGLINGGIYMLNVRKFLSLNWPEKFSFEKDYLEKARTRIYGYQENAYFIDIGIPQDLTRAQMELSRKLLDLDKIDNTWTLFIDRDGVVNPEKKDDYIRNWAEFRFYEGVTAAFQICSNKFGKIIIVSNQRGIGKKLMTEQDLLDIHARMKAEIVAAGGRVDAIYYCTSTDHSHPDRKPNPGMAFHAKMEHPEIDLSRSIMIGNKPSDMLFGKNAGMYTVFVATTNPDVGFPHEDIDLRFNSLPGFAKAL